MFSVSITDQSIGCNYNILLCYLYICMNLNEFKFNDYIKE